MKKIAIAGLVFLLAGCQQFNDTIAAADKKIDGLNNAIGETFGGKKQSDFDKGMSASLGLWTPDNAICDEFRRDPNAARKKYIGERVGASGEAQCRIESLATIRVNNVVFTARDEKNINELRSIFHDRTSIYLEPTGKITAINDFSKETPKGSDCVISADLEHLFR